MPKTMFFSAAVFDRFWIVLGKVLERSCEGFGTSWRLLGHFLASFFKALLPRGLKRVQEAAKRSLGLDFGGFQTGFGKGLGGQNGQNIEIFGIFWICFSRL